MKSPKDGEICFFVDEFGDPVFYNKRGKLIVGTEGCSLILGLGFIETADPKPIREKMRRLHAEVMEDPFLTRIPSVMKHTSVAFHANKDAPEVKHLVYRTIAELDFKAQLVVSCKSEHVFRELYRCDKNEYYDGMVSRLFENVLHRFRYNNICFASRGSRDRRRPLEQALLSAKRDFEVRRKVSVQPDCRFKVEVQSPKGEPCLSVIDYVAWALQRAYVYGEAKYYEYIEGKISYITDLREHEISHYSRKRPFDIKRAALLQLGSSR